MNDKLKLLLDSMLESVRNQLGIMNDMNDLEVMDLIISEVYSEKYSSFLSEEEADSLIKKIFYKTRRRLGILEPLMDDSEVTEIMVNGPKQIFYEKKGKIKRYSLCFDSEDELEEVMRNIASDVHREINEMNPIVDARLEDGSRVNGVYKNVAVNGPILTIRKFHEGYMSLNDLVINETVTEEAALLLKTLVRCGYNLFISGGTSSGKTTLLNSLADSVPKEERVIVIEDSMELKLNGIENIVHMEVRRGNADGKGEVTMAELIKSSLRMRPDRIIVGEVRGAEVLEMINAMNTGHQGSMSTGHGNSASGMLRRLESMYLMAASMNVDAIRSQIAEGIDIMIHIEKIENVGRRIVEILELNGYRDGEFDLNCIMRMNEEFVLKRSENMLRNTRKLMLKGEENANILRQNGFIH